MNLQNSVCCYHVGQVLLFTTRSTALKRVEVVVFTLCFTACLKGLKIGEVFSTTVLKLHMKERVFLLC